LIVDLGGKTVFKAGSRDPANDFAQAFHTGVGEIRVAGRTALIVQRDWTAD
tara:strand:+ start:1539 stop:1691 length:153 start_codon:yes stop_codon:yes gene_type:complete